MKKGVVLILGGRSDVGIEVAHRFTKERHDIQLAARNVTAFKPTTLGLESLYNVKEERYEFDALDVASHNMFVDGLGDPPEIAVSSIRFLGLKTTFA